MVLRHHALLALYPKLVQLEPLAYATILFIASLSHSTRGAECTTYPFCEHEKVTATGELGAWLRLGDKQLLL